MPAAPLAAFPRGIAGVGCSSGLCGLGELAPVRWNSLGAGAYDCTRIEPLWTTTRSPSTCCFKRTGYCENTRPLVCELSFYVRGHVYTAVRFLFDQTIDDTWVTLPESFGIRRFFFPLFRLAGLSSFAESHSSTAATKMPLHW